MKAAVFVDPGKIEVRSDVSNPSPGPGEVLVRVQSCGICGSDMHLYRTNAHRGPSLLKVSPEGFEIPGHEYSGVVEAIGAGVEGVAIGERVVGVTGGGAFAERVTVPVNVFQLAKLPDNVSFDEAATSEPLADAIQIVRLAGVNPGENVVVFGVGIIGLGVIQVLNSSGTAAGNIIAIDVSPARLAMAKTLGATATINPREVDPVAAVAKLCGTVPSVFSPVPAPDVGVVIDCAGYLKHMTGPPPLQTALDLLRPVGGRIVCFGAFEGAVTLDLTNLLEKQPRIIGSLGYAAGELQQAVDLMARGEIDRKCLVTDHFPLDRITEAFETQGKGSAIKVMVHPH